MLTSNLGNEALADLPDARMFGQARPRLWTRYVTRSGRILNRLDEILLFRRLSRDDMTGSSRSSSRGCAKYLAIARSLSKSTTRRSPGLPMPATIRFRRRPLKRVIQRELQNPLAQRILEDHIPDGSTVNVSAGDKGLVIGEIATAEAA